MKKIVTAIQVWRSSKWPSASAVAMLAAKSTMNRGGQMPFDGNTHEWMGGGPKFEPRPNPFFYFELVVFVIAMHALPFFDIWAGSYIWNVLTRAMEATP